MVKLLSSNFSSSSKESIHTVQCGFADDMDYQNCSDLAPKSVEYGQISAQYIQDVIHIYVLHIVVRLFAGALRFEENPESYNS